MSRCGDVRSGTWVAPDLQNNVEMTDGDRLVYLSGTTAAGDRWRHRRPSGRFGLPNAKGRSVRVKGIDTAEIYGTPKGSDEYQREGEHPPFARAWFEENADEEGWPLIVSTDKDHGRYRRWLGRITSKTTGDAYNEDVVDEFPAVASLGDGQKSGPGVRPRRPVGAATLTVLLCIQWATLDRFRDTAGLGCSSLPSPGPSTGASGWRGCVRTFSSFRSGSATPSWSMRW